MQVLFYGNNVGKKLALSAERSEEHVGAVRGLSIGVLQGIVKMLSQGHVLLHIRMVLMRMMAWNWGRAKQFFMQNVVTVAVDDDMHTGEGMEYIIRDDPIIRIVGAFVVAIADDVVGGEEVLTISILIHICYARW